MGYHRIMGFWRLVWVITSIGYDRFDCEYHSLQSEAHQNCLIRCVIFFFFFFCRPGSPGKLTDSLTFILDLVRVHFVDSGSMFNSSIVFNGLFSVPPFILCPSLSTPELRLFSGTSPLWPSFSSLAFSSLVLVLLSGPPSPSRFSLSSLTLSSDPQIYSLLCTDQALFYPPRSLLFCANVQ